VKSTPIKRLYYDLEMSQAIAKLWGSGKQYVHASQIIEPQKIISFHWSWEGENEVHNIDWGLEKQCDKRVLKQIAKQFKAANEVVAHNGNRFDMKKVYNRALFHNIHLPVKPAQIDTMLELKKIAYMDSYSLKEACKYFKLPLKLDAGGISTWDDIQFKKCKKALDHLLYYGDGDITSLKALYKKLEPYIKPKFNHSVNKGLEKYNCPNCGNIHIYHNKQVTTASGTIHHWMRCSDRACNKYFKINNKTHQDWIKFKLNAGIK